MSCSLEWLARGCELGNSLSNCADRVLLILGLSRNVDGGRWRYTRSGSVGFTRPVQSAKGPTFLGSNNETIPIHTG